ncbi:MAG: RidA family protein [Thermoplasmata archaeon]
MTPTPSERLKELGITLVPPAKPVAAYSHAVVDGDHVWVSGQIVLQDGKPVSPGLVDRDVPVDVAKELARRGALQVLNALAGQLGSIDQVKGILRVTVYVASIPGFGRQPEVANGATELFIQIFGEAGRPARAAIGVAALPFNVPVEVECLARTA